jgi:uncharacterized protein (DUF362 family)
VIDDRAVVALRAEAAAYPSSAPFSPSERYPEYSWETGSERNVAYGAVRRCFAMAGLDDVNRGSASWNPLGDLLNLGETVVLKPNFIKEAHPVDPGGWEWILTHGSVIRAVADYVFKAVGSSGRVVIADAPQTDSSFDAVVKVLQLDRVAEFYRARGLNLDFIDLRQEEWQSERGVIVRRRTLPGDPAGAVAYDLGASSEFATHDGRGNYYGADYDAQVVNAHHSGGRHEYLLSRSVMAADAVFSLPKLKTHKKAGITVSLKNLIGVNADKNWLPHHTEGDPTHGGDEHPSPTRLHRIERRAVAALRQLSLRAPGIGPRIHQRARSVGVKVFGDTEEVVRSGNWSGNDTIWRTCLDLNKLVLYGAADGALREPSAANRRRHLVLVDGILAGDGNGPVHADRLPAGVLLFGTHPASVDAAAAVLMGFDPDRIPIVQHAFEARGLPLAEWGWRDVRVVSDEPAWSDRCISEIGVSECLGFRPHFGWVGAIERSEDRVG